MTEFFDLRTRMTYEIRSSVTKKISNQELNEVVDALIGLGEEIDHATLRSVGIVILKDGSALLRAEPEVINHILNQMRQARSRAEALSQVT
jgi:hypothetical protein